MTTFLDVNANRVYTRVRIAEAPYDMSFHQLRAIYRAAVGVEPEHIHVPDGRGGVDHAWFGDASSVSRRPQWSGAADEDQPRSEEAIAVQRGDWIAIDG